MTYQSALEWCVNNKPLADYSDFADWYNACKDAINTPSLFSNSIYNRMMEETWIDEYGSLEDSEETIETQEVEIEPSRVKEVETTVISQPKKNRVIDALGNVFVRDKVETIKIRKELEQVGIDLPDKSFIPKVRPVLPPTVIITPPNTTIIQKQAIIDRLKGIPDKIVNFFRRKK